MKIGVVVPVLNNFRGFTELVYSAKSKHELRWYVQPQYQFQRPLAAAWNTGYRSAVGDGCEYIAILNDDVLLSPKTLDNLAKTLVYADERIELVTATNVIKELADPYDIFTYTEIGWDWATLNDHPHYSCFMVRCDFFERAGSFDENFDPAWCEDHDSHIRLKLLGYRGVATTYASIVHFGSVTTKQLPQVNSQQSREYFKLKWGEYYSETIQPYAHPYNDPQLTPKDWLPNYLSKL